MAESVWKPHVTVAALAEQEGKFLLVEEQIGGQLILNQPAGHLEDGESLLNAVVRETREETAWEFSPEAIVGLYQWKAPGDPRTYLRVAFAGHCTAHHPEEKLDVGILRALWLGREDVVAEPARLRSPMVLRCIDDYLKGQRFPLDMLQDLNQRPVTTVS